MSSIWQNNKMLKRWEEKNLKKHVNGDFNYDLNTPQETPLIAQLSKELQINKDYIYIGAGSSQFITGIISLNLWENIILPKYEFSLYEKACKIYGKSKNRFKFLKKLISHNTGRVCLTMKDNKKGKI